MSLPQYTCRYSQRAKRIFLSVKSDNTVELVLPMGTSEKKGHRFMLAHKDWVLKQLLRNGKRLPVLVDNQTAILNLRAVNRSMHIQYHSSRFARIRLQALSDVLNIYLPQGGADLLHVKQVVIAWLKREANAYLQPIFFALSERLKLPYKQLSFRAQKTLWGSCSAKHHISLNISLLFVPLPLVKYVMIHELCHTRHMDHSRQFWRLVAQYDSAYRVHDKALKSHAVYVHDILQDVLNRDIL